MAATVTQALNGSQTMYNIMCGSFLPRLGTLGTFSPEQSKPETTLYGQGAGHKLNAQEWKMGGGGGGGGPCVTKDN